MSDDIKKVVDAMNDAIFMSDHSDHEFTDYFQYSETPIGSYVKFMGFYVWDSENDYREWLVDPETLEETEEREALATYLWNQMSMIKHRLYQSMRAIEKVLPEAIQIV
jgi:hypothetical protein